MATELKYYDLETASGTVQVQLTDKDAEARGYSVKDGRPGPKPAKRAGTKAATTANKGGAAANKAAADKAAADKAAADKDAADKDAADKDATDKDADTGGVGTLSTADAGTPPAATK